MVLVNDYVCLLAGRVYKHKVFLSIRMYTRICMRIHNMRACLSISNIFIQRGRNWILEYKPNNKYLSFAFFLT